MNLTEKVSYLKGLTDGLGIDETKPENKIIKAMIDILDDLALTVSDLEDSFEILGEQVDAIDEDLDDLECFIFEDDDFSDDDEDEEYYDVECPSCGEVICIDEGILEEGGIECPNCGEELEFDIEMDCDCEDCHKEEEDKE